ncbi:hypothetical protein Cgig2_024518 [Carnegiea gigantea]|uniref:Uncharacterized protein n=1 Tax=Carnegiea gigantea TaxID=171969 RepID=A0A9Q1GHW2_9CARY|nr:hypothetical protein Cgig2_024518 [Carnegiea gigantea]
MTAAYAEELDVLLRIVVDVNEKVVQDLKWYSFEVWLAIHKEELLSASRRALAYEVAANLAPSLALEESVGSNNTLRWPVEATFYAVVVNDVLDLGILTRNIALVLKSTLMDLCWYTFEMWFKIHRRDLLEGRQPPVALAPVGPSFIPASSMGQEELWVLARPRGL